MLVQTGERAELVMAEVTFVGVTIEGRVCGCVGRIAVPSDEAVGKGTCRVTRA
jgi:hypothetical protein